jgi:hypothetical protein
MDECVLVSLTACERGNMPDNEVLRWHDNRSLMAVEKPRINNLNYDFFFLLSLIFLFSPAELNRSR